MEEIISVLSVYTALIIVYSAICKIRKIIFGDLEYRVYSCDKNDYHYGPPAVCTRDVGYAVFVALAQSKRYDLVKIQIHERSKQWTPLEEFPIEEVQIKPREDKSSE